MHSMTDMNFPERHMLRMLLTAAVFFAATLAVLAQDKTKPSGEAPDATVKPVARQIDWWEKRHQAVLEKNKAGKADVLFIGDSIMQGWETTGKAEWEKRFAPLNAVNLGFSGDRTQHVLWRLGEGKELDGIEPKAAVLMIGTNNSGTNSAEKIAAGIEAIVKLIRDKQPRTKILLLAVFPRGEKPDHAQRVKLRDVNERLRKLDDEQYVRFLDIGEKFLKPDGTLPKELMPDFLHLSPAGYKVWADAIEGPLKELLR
jgi:lysophospholipase L1-like esterase